MYESLNMITKKFDQSSWPEEEEHDATYDYASLEGPWNDEPDKAQWIDPDTDLDCLIVRNRMGNLCGYVGVTQDHPWFGISYGGCTDKECPKSYMTAREEWERDKAELLSVPEDERIYPMDSMIASNDRMNEGTWGDRSAHCWDHSPESKVEVHGGLTFSDKCSEENPDGICHVPQNGRTPHVWWFGFDCGHAFDFSPGMRAFELSKPEIFGKRSGRPTDGDFGDKYRDFDYVVEEVSNLARQLKENQ